MKKITVYKISAEQLKILNKAGYEVSFKQVSFNKNPVHKNELEDEINDFKKKNKRIRNVAIEDAMNKRK